MERYHIFKLGLAIIFYAAYCVRPMLVYSLEADSNLENNKNVLDPEHEYFQYFHGVDGKPGRDYPVYAYIPKTTFNCRGIGSGYYADLETDCQVFHICEEGKKISFLCPNGTIFQQSELICEWWNKVNCTDAPSLYEESAERLQNEYARRKESRRVATLNGAEMDHGAVMRQEERTSVRTTKNGKDVRQKVIRTQRIKNHRIPDNNDIEQQIEEAESNNRHLANPQNIAQISQENVVASQNRKHSNHNYNAVRDTDIINDSSIQSSRSKQAKKDIDQETGNFINQNYGQATTRHSKKVDQGEKNNYNYDTKTTKQKSTTLKEYHIEFGATSPDVDYSTKSYSPSQGTNYFSAAQNLEINGSNIGTSSPAANLNGPQNVVSPKLSTSTEAVAALPDTFIQDYHTSNVKNEYDSKVSSRNSFARTPQQSKQNPTTNGKANRGSIKYFNTQELQEDHVTNKLTSQPVTTYSPPVKYSSSTISQRTNLSNQRTLAQGNYELPFPKHKSELPNEHSSGAKAESIQRNFNFASQSSTAISKQSGASVRTEASTQFIPSNMSPDSTNENGSSQGSKNLESDETQVPEESSSFVKNSFNSITDSSLKTSSSPYPNHRSTYSDIKDISYLEAPKIQSISSITAHLVTTQPINNGKPFIGSRVGTTLLPNQPTTLSKYTYLPTTSTDRSKSTIIFGVIRHSPTTEPPPYGPPELFNLGGSTKSPLSDGFNVGDTDKTLPPVETTTFIPNPISTESFNIGNTDSTLKPNIVPSYGITTIKPSSLFIPEHGSLNVGTSEASVTQSNQEQEFTHKNQAEFRLGDTEGTPISSSYYSNNIDYTSPNIETSSPGSSVNQDGETSTLGLYSDRFNIGNTDRTVSTVETTTFVTNPIPTEAFNVGYTGSTIKPNVLPSFETSTIQPLKIYVPEYGSLNLGHNEAKVIGDYNDLEPVNEPPFIKKTVPLLYGNQSNSLSTARTVDHATVYGTYASTTQRVSASSSNTPYSPTVPTVTQSSLTSYQSTTFPRTPKAFNQGIPIRFANGQDKISVQLSKNLGGQTQPSEQFRYKSTLQPSQRKINAVVRVGDVKQFGSTTFAPYNHAKGFYVTEDFSNRIPKSKTERPRPFARTVDIEGRLNAGTTNSGSTVIGSTFPAYKISSARPFGVSETTSSTPFITTQTTPSFSVYDNVDSMMNVLQEIANFNSQTDHSGNSRPGLVIPPSVGPQTLHSLAQYFANELQNSDSEKAVLKPETKEKLTSLLTAMTVHGYNKLFSVETTTTPTDATSTISGDFAGTTAPTGNEESNKDNDDIKLESKNAGKDDSNAGDDNLLTTTSLPELRQLARNFSLALSSYLNDPDNFKKSLEGLRPTEPPPLGSDNIESSTTEDELLNFSDADAKPSTPIIPTATWGYIVATGSKTTIQDDVKNSLNPDLNTADSQSFIPKFNNVQVNERQQKGFTDLPPNHWTSSPKATKLWQKALTVNPAVVNEHFETTTSMIASDEEETTEPELFNHEVLPDLNRPHSEISYDLRELPPISLNSTQVHGILIDFMNHTKSNEDNRLNRILKKLNTSEEEFLSRMKEIESNPLTKRLVLLLISECGANITQDLGVKQQTSHQNEDTLSALASTASFTSRNAVEGNRENHSLRQLVHPKLNEDEQDARALQLLNSLYTIASKFGRKR